MFAKFCQSLFIVFIALPTLFFVVITPMNANNQYIFSLTVICACVLISAWRKNQHLVSLIVLMAAVTMSTRYMYFRLTQTLEFHSLTEALCGDLLLLAEIYIYIVLILSSFQISWAMQRPIVPMPDDVKRWPTVDVYIPTYNEPLEVVKDTVLAAQCLDYPHDKLSIYLLDDGRRPEFAAFATEAHVGYLTRDNNEHAKAGNLNHALTLTHGEFITVFDCDHICTKIFLQATIGAFFKDPRLALLQTPHHFYSPDPIKRNLYFGRDIPAEHELFYGPVQQGNDNWNAAFFCGSCAVIRRAALDEIHGFAVETVTEDAHTALRLQRHGWNTAYLNKRMAGGLATERVMLHIIQRNRWARGMLQIFRLDNPLLGRGLTLAQRLCYLSAMMYFLFAIPRVIFLGIPLLYLITGLSVVHGSAALLFAYALPHLFLSFYAASRINGRYRHSFWGEIYDVLLSFPLVLPTLAVLISPHHGKFNPTDKGGTVEHAYFDAHAVRPHLICAGLLLFGIVFGAVKLMLPQYFDVQLSSLALNCGWAFYNLTLLTAAICVARETANKRHNPRLNYVAPVVIYQQSGICTRSQLCDISMTGCRIVNTVGTPDRLQEDPITDLELESPYGNFCIPVETILLPGSEEKFLHFHFTEINTDTRRELVRIMFSRPDTWDAPPHRQDGILRSFFTVFACIYDSLSAGRQHRHAVASKVAT